MKKLTKSDCVQLVEEGKLVSGETYTYKQLCEIFGEKYYSGGSKSGSKKSQLEKWNTFCVFEHPINPKTKKESTKFKFFGVKGNIAPDIYQPYKGRKSEITYELKQVVLYCIRHKFIQPKNKEDNETIFVFNMYELYHYVGFCDKYARWEKRIEKEFCISKFEYEFFDKAIKERFNYYLNRTLKDLQADGVIEFGYCIIDNYDNYFTDEKIIEWFDDYNIKACKMLDVTMQEVVLKGLWKELSIERNKLMKRDGCNVRYKKKLYVKILNQSIFKDRQDVFDIYTDKNNKIVNKFIAEKCAESINRRLKNYEEDLENFEDVILNDGEYNKRLSRKRDRHKARWVKSIMDNSDMMELLECGLYSSKDIDDMYNTNAEENFRVYLMKSKFKLREDLKELSEIYADIIMNNIYSENKEDAEKIRGKMVI